MHVNYIIPQLLPAIMQVMSTMNYNRSLVLSQLSFCIAL